MPNGSEHTPEHPTAITVATDLKLWRIEYSGPLVRIDKHNLPDLDDLLLDVLMHPDIRSEALWEWEDDYETRIRSETREGLVGFYRTNPCSCGDHKFDMDTVRMDDDGNPIGKAARGAFLGVFFQ